MKAIHIPVTQLRTALLTSLVIFATNNAFAHTTLQSAIPATNAIIAAQPEKLVLNFGEPVMLMNIKVTDGQQKSIPLNYKVNSALKKSYEIALPKLADSTYTVAWTTMGKDGHNMAGKYNFTLKHAQ